MGCFLVRQVDQESGVEIARFAVPNLLAYEGMERVYRQLFPPFDPAMSFKVGVSGATTIHPSHRPNLGGGAGFGTGLTFDQCTGDNANEGGCYSDEMRESFGYTRRDVGFTASLEADGGALVAPEVTFPNNHSWTPQEGADWDLSWTAAPEEPEGKVEQPPPEWAARKSWEPVVKYPWQRPRKRCQSDCDPGDPNSCAYSYMYQWDQTGALDWLCDFRKLGGFPISLAFLIDSSQDKLIAAAKFRGSVLLRPGTALHVKYQARMFGSQVTRDFAYRFARYAFGKTGSRYGTIYCRPVLAEAPAPTRRTTYSQMAEYFHPHFEPVLLSSWTYVTGAPPRIESAIIPLWPNSSGAPIGPLGYLAVYGLVGSTEELMWVTEIDPPVTIDDDDTLCVPNKVRFQFDGV